MEAQAHEHVVEAEGLEKRFGDVHAVRGVDFAVRRGECFGFLGPNGAGKTTTMRMIYRATRPTAGKLTILGLDATTDLANRQIKQKLGVVPQVLSLDQELSVRQNLMVFCRFHGLRGAAARKRTSELIEFVDLQEKADAPVLHLSGGMQRRALIARGLVGSPELVILDEPTTGLDPKARQKLWERLHTLKQKQATLILTTHYMEEAQKLCDRLVIMDEGRIVARGTPRELIDSAVPASCVEVDRRPGEEAAEAELKSQADRAEVLADRMLLYTDDGEALLAHATRTLPGHRTLLRPSSLEDVFLALTGHALDDA
ncbi:MAG: ABC transporter ATP-binding protein [Planctomycetota bacterium]|jgi:lipooligosaccharide transport system ATP-binding protein